MATTATSNRSRERIPGGAPSPDPRVTSVSAKPEVVRVFSLEPDLLEGLDVQAAEFLTQRAVASKLWIEPGPWDPPPRQGQHGDTLGLLVLDGLLMRNVELHGRRCPELVGAGDLLRPWDDLEGSLVHDVFWTAVTRASVALLDERFLAIIGRWPRIIDALLMRSIHRARSLAINLAIAHVRHAELRLHLLFWHLADRWGRVTTDGVHLPLRLTHEMLAELACMRRPTASSAINALTRRGELMRRDDATWLLVGAPPSSRSS